MLGPHKAAVGVDLGPLVEIDGEGELIDGVVVMQERNENKRSRTRQPEV